jgi:hypothetical protein
LNGIHGSGEVLNLKESTVSIMFWEIISWLIVGIVAGWAAGHLARGRGFGILGNMVVGIVGAAIGGFVFGL